MLLEVSLEKLLPNMREVVQALAAQHYFLLSPPPHPHHHTHTRAQTHARDPTPTPPPNTLTHSLSHTHAPTPTHTLQYMLRATQDEDELVALEACEFWSSICETKATTRHTPPPRPHSE